MSRKLATHVQKMTEHGDVCGCGSKTVILHRSDWGVSEGTKEIQHEMMHWSTQHRR